MLTINDSYTMSIKIKAHIKELVKFETNRLIGGKTKKVKLHLELMFLILMALQTLV